MKLWNERAMYIVIYISLSFHETSSLYDENDNFDSDLIPFLSIGTKPSHISLKDEKISGSAKTTSQARYFVKNLQTHNYVSDATIPSRHYNSTQNNIRNFLQSELNEPLTLLYEKIKDNITGDSKSERGRKDSANMFRIKNSDFINQNQQFSNSTYSPKLAQKFSIFNKTNSNEIINTDDRLVSGIIKRNNDDFDKYTLSNFFDSLLSLLSNLNPHLLNVLNENIKKFQRYNIIKRDSVSNSSPYSSNENSTTLKSILCNCNYCRTGIPDTVLYIVSGKKLNNSVTYHKLTSVNNRSKSKTSYRYQLQTADDNDSYLSLHPRYLPVNYDKPIFGNSCGNANNEKGINKNVMTNNTQNQQSMMNFVPAFQNLGSKLMPGYKHIRGRGLYIPPNEKNEVPPNIPFRKVVEPNSNIYKPSFYFGNRPLPRYTDWKNYEEKDCSNDSIEPFSSLRQTTIQSTEFRENSHNRRIISEEIDPQSNKYKPGINFGNYPFANYAEKYYSNDGIEPFNSLHKSTTMHSTEFRENGHNGWIMSNLDGNESLHGDEVTNGPTLRNLSRAIKSAELNENCTGNSNEITKTLSNRSPLESKPYENYISIEVPDNDAGSLTTEASYNMNILHTPSSKRIDKNNYLKNIYHTEKFQKGSVVATDDKTVMFLPRVSKTDIPPDINEDYKYTRAIHGMNTVSNEQNCSTKSLEKSIIDIFNKLMYNVEGRSINRTKPIETATKTFNITLSYDENNISNNTNSKNGSVWKHHEMPDSSTAFSKQTGLSDSALRPSLITTIVTTTTILNNSINKKETYVNYDLNLRNLIGESIIDDKIMCS